jgi:hypothetical protein
VLYQVVLLAAVATVTNQTYWPEAANVIMMLLAASAKTLFVVPFCATGSNEFQLN